MHPTGGPLKNTFALALAMIAEHNIKLLGTVVVFNHFRAAKVGIPPPSMADIGLAAESSIIPIIEQAISKHEVMKSQGGTVNPETIALEAMQALALNLAIECEKSLGRESLVITRRS